MVRRAAPPSVFCPCPTPLPETALESFPLLHLLPGPNRHQVHEPIRIVAIEVSGDNPRYPYKPKIPLTILVNPVLEVIGAETFDNYEGCLSVPNLRGKVTRHAHLRVRAWDRHGAELDFEARGISAGTYQHEVDHLDGIVFVDRVKDASSFSTWENFDRHHRDAFVAYAKEIVALHGG